MNRGIKLVFNYRNLLRVVEDVFPFTREELTECHMKMIHHPNVMPYDQPTDLLLDKLLAEGLLEKSGEHYQITEAGKELLNENLS